ncbi:MAG: NAD(P)/FAD-dependent oxidoreductase [Candidatus Acidiferrales bacterium]
MDLLAPTKLDQAIPRERWAVVGGGVLGMLLAHRLAQAGRAVTLFEAAPQLGGLTSVWQLGGTTWDRHYHVIVPSDSYLRAVLRELQLDHEIRWVQTRVGFSVNGAMHSMSSAWEFLRFPPLNLLEKIRLAATIGIAPRLYGWNALEAIPVEQWLRKWSGNAVTEKIWIPLLRSKLGENYRHTSAAFIWGSIQRMYAARRSGAKREVFGYVPGGYARILDRFQEQLARDRVTVRMRHAARSVEPQPSGEVAVQFENGHRESFDQVVLSMAAPIAARLCPRLTDDEKARLNGITYLGILCASVLLRKPLSGFYVTNLTDSWPPFTGVIEMTALVDRQQFGSNTLVYLPKYLASGDPAFALSDAEIEQSFLAALFRMYPHLDRSDVLAFCLSREKYVMAIPTLNYTTHLPPMHMSIPGLHIINSAHIVTGTLAVDTTFQLGESAARQLVALPSRVAATAALP